MNKEDKQRTQQPSHAGERLRNASTPTLVVVPSLELTRFCNLFARLPLSGTTAAAAAAPDDGRRTTDTEATAADKREKSERRPREGRATAVYSISQRGLERVIDRPSCLVSELLAIVTSDEGIVPGEVL